MRDIRPGKAGPAPKPPRPHHVAGLRHADAVTKAIRDYPDNPAAGRRRLKQLGASPTDIRKIHSDYVRNQRELKTKGFLGASAASLARDARAQRRAKAMLAAQDRLEAASKRAKPMSRGQQLNLSVDVGLKRAGITPDTVTSRFDFGRALHNLGRQTVKAPVELGPALAIAAKSGAEDFSRAVTFNYGHPLRKPHSETLEKVVKPTVEHGRFLVSHDPIVVRIDKDGRKVYRAKGGGETTDVRLADTSLGAKLEEYPLDFALGGRAAALGVGKLAALARPRLAMPTERLTLRSRTGHEFTTPLHPNPVRRAEQQATRKLSTGVTGAVEKLSGRELPILGEHARAVRLGTKQRRRRERADVQRTLAPFDRAMRQLKAGEKIAVVLHANGLKPSELTAFVQERLAAARAAGNKAEARDHIRMLRFLRKTSDETYANVTADTRLSTARTEAKRVSDLSGDLLQKHGLLDPFARALRPYLSARVVRGARYAGPRGARAEMFRDVRAARPELVHGVRQAARESGATAVVAAYKRAGEIQRKIGKKGDVGRVRDVLRGSLVVPDESAVQGAVAALRKHMRVLEVERAGNHGYVATKAHVQVGDHVAEIQIVTRPMFNASRDLGHKLYEQWRVLPDGDPRKAELAQEMEALYAEAAGAMPRSRIKSLSSGQSGRPIARATQTSGLTSEAPPNGFNQGFSSEGRPPKTSQIDTAPVAGSRATGMPSYRPSSTPSGRSASTSATIEPGTPEIVQRQVGGFANSPQIHDLVRELGDQVFHHPHAGKQLREGQVPQSMSGAGPLRKPDLIKKNRAIRLLTSRWLPTPQAWQDGYLKAIGYAHAVARGELAYKIARPLNPDGTVNRGWRYVNLDGVDLKGVRDRQALQQGMADFLEGDGDVEGFIDSNLTTKNAETAARWAADGKRVAQISPSDYRNIFGEFKGSSEFVRRVLDRPTDFWRALTLTYRPAWVVNNFVGQTLLYAINHATPGGAGAYAQAVLDEARKSDRYFPEDLRYGLFQSEQAQAAAIPGPRVVAGVLSGARNAERAMRDKIGAFNAALSDNIPRRAAWYQVADTHRKLINRIEGTNKKLDDFLGELERAAKDPAGGDAKLRQLHDDLVQEVLHELIDFNDLSQFERSVIRRAIPFYSWLKGITKATVHLGLNKPLTAELLNAISQGVGERELRKWLGAGEQVLQNFLPFNAENTPAGRIATGLSTQGLNPFQTVSDVERMTLGGESPFDNPANALAPWAQSAIEALTHKDMFSGKALQSPLGGQGALGLPALIAQQYARGFPQATLADQLLNPRGELGKNGKPILTPGGGDIAGVPLAVLNYLGIPVKRKNLDRAAQLAEEQRRAGMAKPELAHEKIGDLRGMFERELRRYSTTHVSMTPVIDKALKAREQKMVALARLGHNPTPLERYDLYLDLLARMGHITPAQAAEFKARGHGASEHDLRSATNSIAEKYFGGAVLGQAAKELRERGSTIELRGH